MARCTSFEPLDFLARLAALVPAAPVPTSQLPLPPLERFAVPAGSALFAASDQRGKNGVCGVLPNASSSRAAHYTGRARQPSLVLSFHAAPYAAEANRRLIASSFASMLRASSRISRSFGVNSRETSPNASMKFLRFAASLVGGRSLRELR
jgi:hypothetical protein